MPRFLKVPALASVAQMPTGHIVDLPGRGSTYVYDSGPCDGPTYILLHSLACTGLMTWYPALDVVRRFGRVVVFDQRCHGQGISPPRLLFEDCADDVAALADVLDIPSFVPVGYSMGSLIAQLVWRRHRDRVDGLVLCAATAAVSRARYERVATGLFAALVESLTPAPRLYPPAGAVTTSFLADYQWVLNQARATSPGGITRAIAEVVRFDSTTWVGDIDVPTSLVVTMKDRAFGVRRQQWLADHIPGAEAVPVEAGHAGCTLQPAAFVPGLARAVESVHRRLPVSHGATEAVR
ncbi:alpha/beta hydrolase [Mycobacterium intermedium]|uniref:Alpha/beta hydrolase n=1 Tax=Mycobacterium intermedium TaxID=28445 RepID=A0A1E3SAV9_MYCIE|nr:alpha/beta fold hydrolase [Mycobacterium intermedium]ODQ99288.1 alpha/beta hydrolase [Mycobacterium intermedium]OPE49138.1 alpha/beta hydrolase [Mycobacterium intermedium]ORB07744.1 alpha/beta hydrolase [Mycobacterium intermedium]